MADARRTTALAASAAMLLLLAAGGDARAQILSSKRGFADTGAGYNNLQASGAGWYYTWGPGVGSPGNFDAKHYPMIWSGTPSQNLLNDLKARNPEYVLGFNEPERGDQANMSVAQAIASWTPISNAFQGTNTKLVSPAVADTGGAAGGQQWLASFMSQAAANNLKVDAVAFHWYGVSTPNDPAGAASSFLSRVQSYFNSYQKPVFITEFAIHDWGGAYTDQEIMEANRQFLDIVIPQLESRSYVAGYSWYHWFSDAPLFNGSPSKPTPMAYSYVGALTAGKTENISGKAYGEHVAYLAGGALTQTAAPPGALKYINALENSSTVGGTVDWALGNGGWVRTQPGATLRKTGANQVTFTGGSITNNGAIEVTEGTLRIGSPVTGAGAVRVRGGTLALQTTGRFDQAPLIEVQSGGTLNTSALASPYLLANAQTLQVDGGAQVVGNVTARFGSTIAGGGSFTGNVVGHNGSLIRVGKNGAGVPTRTVIDNFESYAVGDVGVTASPPWTPHQGTTAAKIETLSANKVLSFGDTATFRGVSRAVPDAAVLDNSEMGTLFFRINGATATPNHNIGLGDVANEGGVDFNDFEAQLRVNAGGSGTFGLDARNGGAFTPLATGLALNTWYNVWMVVNQATDQYDIYVNTGPGGALAANKRNATPLAFRQGTSSDLSAILAYAGATTVNGGVRIDDLVFQAGLDLTNPSTNFNPGLVWTPETLSINGNFMQQFGSALELNLLNPASHDKLVVTGQADVGGILRVTLAVGAPQPQLGDAFDLFAFGSAVGAFSALELPALAPNLVWKTNELLATGVLTAVALVPGDFTRDGGVDGADLLRWQTSFGIDSGGDADGDGDTDGADFVMWQRNLGNGVLPLGQAVTAAVPEPNTAAGALVTAVAIAVTGRRPADRRPSPIA